MKLFNGRRGAAASWWTVSAGIGALVPGIAAACACGCGLFDVGTASMFPSHSGGMAYLEYDFMDQDRNWSGTASAPAADNSDKRIRTGFWNAGLEYQFNRSWGALLEVPYWERQFRTLGPDGATLGTFQHGAVGDIRIKGVYTGLSADMSTGITFGLKLPTGDSTYAHFDPDTEIGSGSTDLLLGAYHVGSLSADNQWRSFVQVQWDQPVRHKSAYRPGTEGIATAGIYYEGWNLTPSAKIAPVMQASASYRGHDGGTLGNPGDSGYTRLVVSPGVEVDLPHVTVYADVGLPVYVNSSGNQLVASRFYRVNLSYRF